MVPISSSYHTQLVLCLLQSTGGPYVDSVNFQFLLRKNLHKGIFFFPEFFTHNILKPWLHTVLPRTMSCLFLESHGLELLDARDPF